MWGGYGCLGDTCGGLRVTFRDTGGGLGTPHSLGGMSHFGDTVVTGGGGVLGAIWGHARLPLSPINPFLPTSAEIKVEYVPKQGKGRGWQKWGCGDIFGGG